MTNGKSDTWDRKCKETKTYTGGTKSPKAWKFIRNLRSETSNQETTQ